MTLLKRRWMGILTAVLAMLYLYVGINSSGADMAAGLIGAALILLTQLELGLSQRIRESLLILGALPLAMMTWWSVVTPILAVLAIVIGSVAIGGGRRYLVAAAP
jgi:hypothetical protein